MEVESEKDPRRDLWALDTSSDEEDDDELSTEKTETSSNSKGKQPTQQEYQPQQNSRENDVDLDRLKALTRMLQPPSVLPMRNAFDFRDTVTLVNHLCDENARLKASNTALLKRAPPKTPKGWVTLHRIQCKDQSMPSTYQDAPTWYRLSEGLFHLQGQNHVSNVDILKEGMATKAFIVWQDYLCDGHDKARRQQIEEERRNKHDGRVAIDPELEVEPYKYSITILSSILKNGLSIISEKIHLFQWEWPEFSAEEFAPPCSLVHHKLQDIDQQVALLTKQERKPMTSFLKFVKQQYTVQKARAIANYEAGMITVEDLEYIFVPRMIIIQEKDGKRQGFHQISPFSRSSFSIEAESWDFNGEYTKRRVILNFELRALSDDGRIRVEALKLYPLEYAPSDVRESLQARGQTHWDCRFHAYVSVNGYDAYGEEKFVSRFAGRIPSKHLLTYIRTNLRFMIDTATYNKLHPKDKSAFGSDTSSKLSEEEMKNDHPPSHDFLFLLPSNIYGFHMIEKKWGTFPLVLSDIQ